MTLEEKLLELAPSVLVVGTLREYWLALSVASAWLLVMLLTRRAQLRLGATNTTWLVVVFSWALQMSFGTIAQFDSSCSFGPPRPAYLYLLDSWQHGLRGLLGLLLVLVLLAVGGLVTRGAALSIRPLAALGALVAILAVSVDWAFILFVTMPVGRAGLGYS